MVTPGYANRLHRFKRSLLVMIVLASSGMIAFSIKLAFSRCENAAFEPTLYIVRGAVLVNGEPAENVNVAFHPRDVLRNAICPVGRTNDKGIFQLVLGSDKVGAPEGEYCVTFVWPDPNIEFDECECVDPVNHDRFKGMYASANDSSYLVLVDAKNTTLKFGLWRPRSNDPLP